MVQLFVDTTKGHCNYIRRGNIDVRIHDLHTEDEEAIKSSIWRQIADLYGNASNVELNIEVSVAE